MGPCTLKPPCFALQHLSGKPPSSDYSDKHKLWFNHRKNCKEPKPTFLFSTLLPIRGCWGQGQRLRENRSGEVRVPMVTCGFPGFFPSVHSSPTTTFPFIMPHATDLPPHNDHPVMNLKTENSYGWSQSQKNDVRNRSCPKRRTLDQLNYRAQSGQCWMN